MACTQFDIVADYLEIPESDRARNINDTVTLLEI